ncbi:MAG: cell wall-active antibiotics response protein [Roseburia sp.]|nr:cell wall-active antibiotics response protein [Roseburia sp.]MCM1098430.1 cell wall-active antibiotics response protein [Ruminococcus flavefaciens]
MARKFEIEVGEPSEGRAAGGRKRKKIFWGIVLIAGAVAMLLSKLGLFSGVGFWRIVFSALLAAFFLNGILRRSFGQILFSLAFLVILNDQLLHLEAITPWPVLLAALVMTAGLKMLFPGFQRGGRGHHWDLSWSPSKLPPKEARAEGTVSYDITFGNTVKYVMGEMTDVYLKSNFGEMEVFLTEAQLKEGTGRIHMSISFGSIQLYVPADWLVVMDLDTAFGGVEQDGKNHPSGENTLYLDGETAFGGLTIHYVGREERADEGQGTRTNAADAEEKELPMFSSVRDYRRKPAQETREK